MSDYDHERPLPPDPESPAPRVPPHNPETEVAVLSAWCLHDRFGAAWKPEPDLFYVPAHRLVATAMGKLVGVRDEASIFAQLNADGSLQAAGGHGAVHAIIMGAPAYGDPWPHVLRLREYKALRDMLGLLAVASAEAYEHKNLGAAVAKVQDAIRAGTAESGTKVFSVADMIAVVAQRMIDKAEARFCSTGLPSLDRDTGGLQYKQVTILGAATNWGKSQFCVMVADKAMTDGKRPLVVSFEDSEELYGRRILARRANVNASLLRTNKFREGSEEWKRVLGAAQNAERTPFFINAVGKTAERVATDIRCVCASEDIDIVLVDYLQAAQCSRRQQDRRNEITYIARILTDVIKASGRAGLMFSQFKRQLKGGETPTMHDLKESGDLENAAEMVLLGYLRNDDLPVVRVDKCKDGIKGREYKLAWDETWCGFKGEAIDDQDYESRYT